MKLLLTESAKTAFRTANKHALNGIQHVNMAIWADITAIHRVWLKQICVRCKKDLQGA